MMEGFRILLLLLRKTFISRKRHWIGTIIEIAAPAIIFSIIMGLRTLVPSGTTYVNVTTNYPILNKTYWQSEASFLLRVLYVPQNEFTIRMMSDTADCMGINMFQIYGHDTEEQMVATYDRLQTQNPIFSVLAVVFNDTEGGSVPTNLLYTLKTSVRVGSTLIDRDYGGPSELSDALVNRIPFVALQMCLDDTFIGEVAPNYIADETSVRYIQKMPYPPYETQDFSEMFFRDTIGNWAAIMFIVTLYLIPSYITTEKEIGVIALLKMNGVKAYHNFFSWIINGMILGTVINALIVVVLKVYFSPNQLPFYYYSNGFVIWVILFINFIHTYAFCLHVGSYFTQARVAQGVMVLIIYAVLQIVTQLENNELYTVIPYLGFFFPTAAAIRLFEEFNSHDNSFSGVQWSNLFATEHEVLGFTGTLGFITLFSIVGIIFHILAALYLDAVLPGKYNVRKSPFFFFKFFRRNKVTTVDTEDDDGQPKILENVADGALTPGIIIRNLTKTFKIGLFKPRLVKAVRGISLDFYKGEITALLGHNGAGKTTAISILTGLTAPTSGTVLINGKDIRNNMTQIRNDLGMCPQENMLFPDLTVLEQLQLFGLLKQKKKTREQVMKDVDELLVKLKISEKRNVLPKNLSGGQKRRVCLGMSLIGDASTLILDEPTSGMDPETSRVTWEIILNYRKQKTIIITTHSMEEADVLGDRIAIMDSGKMRCYGTSMFLKKYYGKNNLEVTLSTEPWCDKVKIQTIMGKDAKMSATTHGRLVLTVPMTNALPEILDKIELMKADLGITGVSVSSITLEEVFLKSAVEDEEVEANGEYKNGFITNGDVTQIDDHVKGYNKLTGSQLTKQVVYALLGKKVSYARNHWGLSTAIVFGALLAVVLMPIFTINRVNTINQRPLDLSLYPNAEALIYGENYTFSSMYRNVVERQGAIGTLIGTETNIIDALIERAEDGLVYYRNNIVISGEFNSTENDTVITNGLYSGSALLSAPITVNAMSNALLKTYAGDQYSITAYIENLPRSLVTYIYNEYRIKTDNLLEMMLFISIFFIVAGLYVTQPLLESTSTIKQLQRMTGVSSISYWGTMFVFDYVFYIISTIVTVIGFVVMDRIFNTQTYGFTEAGIVILLMLMFGVNVLLEAYVFSFWKKPLYVVLLVLSLANIVVAQLQVFVHLALEYMWADSIGFMVQKRLFTLLPHVSFTFGFSKFLEISANNARCRRLPNSFGQIACALSDPCCDLGCADGYCEESLPYFQGFDRDGTLEEYLLYLGLTPIVLLAMLFTLEHQVFSKLLARWRSNKSLPSGHSGVVDSDVVKEKNAIREAINQRETEPNIRDENVFLAYELSKRYNNLEAVREVNFRVKNHECFGILGVNGAGKSTTFRMLVGEDTPSSGILIRGNQNIKLRRKEYLAGMGYCPQINALIPSFNAYEHLSLFARLRGVPKSEVMSEVELWIDKLKLNKYAQNSSQSYSGGNKRRLNIAMALIARPELVLLDEPTAGVDPGARRSLWTVLQNCQTSGQSIILTSHSMEECEALCNRLLIMVSGQLVCVGASQQLKQRFSAGYDITVKLNPERTEDELEKIKEKIQEAFVCELRDEHPGYLLYHVTESRTSWVKMFGTMNDLKSQHSSIEDFTVSSATLEQLFIQFARSASGSTLTATTPVSNGIPDVPTSV